MAGTILDRKLTTGHPGRAAFKLATPADDASLRRLLRENPMAGRIALTFEREPNYFADADPLETEQQTIVAHEAGQLVCAGNCALRKRFVNGRPQRVGYLGGLRLASPACGRFDLLRRGYEFFRELQAQRPADFYFTSIAADNFPARKFLERGLPGMPIYEFISDFVTLLLPTRLHSTAGNAPNSGNLTFVELAPFLNESGREYQFAPYWSATELAALQPIGLTINNFQFIRENGRLIAAAALWDQRCFKQTVIRNYQPWLAIARPALNCAAALLRQPRLPAPGSTLSHAFVSHLALAMDKPERLINLIKNLSACAAKRGLEFLTAGFAAHDPRLSVMRDHFRFREYHSRLCVVRWPGLGGAARELESRCLAPEVALL
jgi:hypothetical protein